MTLDELAEKEDDDWDDEHLLEQIRFISYLDMFKNKWQFLDIGKMPKNEKSE